MRALELKIPPLLLALAAAALMWGLARLAPSLGTALAWRAPLAAGLFCAGLVVGLAGVLSFRRARTTVNPLRPDSASALVNSGIYRYSRNPMYLALLLGLVAWAAWLGHLLALPVLAGFVLYMNHFQIRPEERALRQLFGGHCERYFGRVRRWL